METNIFTSKFLEVVIFVTLCLIVAFKNFKLKWVKPTLMLFILISYFEKDIYFNKDTNKSLQKVYYTSSDITAYQTNDEIVVTYKKPTLSKRSPEFKEHTKHWFDKVMYGLIDLSKITGIDYQSLNVIIYCILVPIILFISIFVNIKFYKYFKRNKKWNK